MKKLIKKLEDIMVAVTFAEAGEYDEARKYSGDSPLPSGEDAATLRDFKKAAYEIPHK